MLQLERPKDVSVVERQREESKDEFCVVENNSYNVPRVLIPNIILAPTLPPLPRQSRAVSTTTPLKEIPSIGIALTKEAFPFHCLFCNRTVVTEPEGVPTWRTWGWCVALIPVFMCVLPWYQGWGCEYRHKCGRCSRVLAIYKQQQD